MLLALGLLVHGAEPAKAGLGTATIGLSPGVGPPTTALTVRGRGYEAKETVELSFDGVNLATATTNARGSFSGSFAVSSPALPGSHVVEAIGEASGDAASATLVVRTDWPKFHFDIDNTGYNPYENVLGPSNVASLTLAWTYHTGAVYGTPAVVGGTAYVTSQSAGETATTSALDAATGSLIWKTKRASYGFPLNGLAYDHGMVFYGTSEGSLHALDAATGHKLWNAIVGGIPSNPEVTGGIVYVGGNFGNVWAFDEQTGTLVWKSAFVDAIYGAPTVSNGLVLVGSTNGNVYGLDALTGSIVWSYQTAGTIGSSVVVSGGLAYVSSGDMNLYALEATTGTFLWKASLGPQKYITPFTPSVANGVVYAGGNSTVQAFDATSGTPLWSTHVGDDAVKSPIGANGVVYIPGGGQGHLYALDAADGTLLWSFKAGGAVYDPVVVNGMLFVGSVDHNLYAFKLP